MILEEADNLINGLSLHEEQMKILCNDLIESFNLVGIDEDNNYILPFINTILDQRSFYDDFEGYNIVENYSQQNYINYQTLLKHVLNFCEKMKHNIVNLEINEDTIKQQNKFLTIIKITIKNFTDIMSCLLVSIKNLIHFLKNKDLFANYNDVISIIFNDIGILIYDYSNRIKITTVITKKNNKNFYELLENEANFISFKKKMELISNQLIKYLNINFLFPLCKKKKEIEDLISGSQENDPILFQSLNEINNRINSQVNVLMPAI